jgi:hypothetical protein
VELTISDGDVTFVVQVEQTDRGWIRTNVLEIIDGDRYPVIFPIGIPQNVAPSPWLAFEPVIRVVVTELMAIKA